MILFTLSSKARFSLTFIGVLFLKLWFLQCQSSHTWTRLSSWKHSRFHHPKHWERNEGEKILLSYVWKFLKTIMTIILIPQQALCRMWKIQMASFNQHQNREFYSIFKNWRRKNRKQVVECVSWMVRLRYVQKMVSQTLKLNSFFVDFALRILICTCLFHRTVIISFRRLISCGFRAGAN